MKVVVLRELGVIVRRPLILILFSLFLIALVVVVAAAWPTGAVINPDELMRTGTRAWRLAALIELGFLLLLAPALGAPALSEERQRRTLELVLLSGLSAGRLALAKLLARSAIVLLALLLPLPMLLAVATLGGVEAVGAAQVLIVQGSTALAACALGLFFSSFTDRPHRSVLGAYAALAIPCALPFLLPALGWTSSALSTGRFALWEAAVSPLRNLEYIFQPALFDPESFIAERFWLQPLIYLAAAAALCLAAGPLLERSLRRRSRAPASARSRLDGLRRRLSNNPVYWRESALASRRGRVLGRVSIAVALAAVALIVAENSPGPRAALDKLAAFIPAKAPAELHLRGLVVGALMAVIAIAGTVTAAASVSDERQSGLLAFLAVTPLSYGRFITGKILGIGERLIVPLLALWTYLAAALLSGEVRPPSGPLVVVGSLATASFALFQGILCALVTNSPTRALALALALLVVESFFPLCCLWTFNAPYFGYLCMTVPDPQMPSWDLVSFTLATVVSLVIQLGAYLLIARALRQSFDAFIGRVGGMELSLDTRR